MFVVTGGGSGIGRALAHELALREKSVLIVGRQENTLNETAIFSPLIRSLCADVSTVEGRLLIAHSLDDIESLHGLIHNAGIIDPISPINTIKETAWRKTMATNVEAPLFLSQLLQHKLLNGRILNISSGAAHFPVVGWSAYCVSKAALSMLTRCWQLECSMIPCTSVMPGIIDTNMQRQIRSATSMETEKVDFFVGLQKNNQLLSPTTVAKFLCWLLLDIDNALYLSKEWDIYDQTHHQAWLSPPHTVPNPWE